jgi:hypothetical protein
MPAHEPYPLKSKPVLIIFKHLFLTAKKKTQKFLRDKNQMVNTVGGNKPADCCENHMKPANTLFWKSAKLLVNQTGGTYNCHSVLEGQAEHFQRQYGEFINNYAVSNKCLKFLLKSFIFINRSLT